MVFVQREVDVSKIESQLATIWESLASPDKIKAALFNLIVHLPDRQHVDYVHRITQGILKKHPSRVIFLIEDPQATEDLLRTQVTLAEISSDPIPVTCDQIQLEFSPSQRKKIPFIILPHFLPDLPVYLLWLGDATGAKNLYEDLEHWISKVIFDPDTIAALPQYTQNLKDLRKRYQGFISDLNWTLIEGWRRAIAALFDSPEQLEQLGHLKSVKMICSTKSTEFNRDPSLPALYLLCWLAAMMEWEILSFQREQEGAFMSFKEGSATIEVAQKPSLSFGTILEVEILSDQGYGYHLAMGEDSKFATVHRFDPQKCDLPYTCFTGRTGRSRALMREMFKEGSSSHFLRTTELFYKLTW
ncbi:MAG: glucose-6-phosphate dehydrogenase assembly protein OpcA [Verrucomicrobia bacterium]|nr:glucose-6-phosphate dehydrogenase assembly protein OpcA [Verrucomicrobiota bacterium]